MTLPSPAPFTSSMSNEPRLIITIQPKKRGYRFRYDSEKMSHGSIPGEPRPEDPPNAKCYPQVKLLGHKGPARVLMTLVTLTNQAHLHPHILIVDKIETKGFHVFKLPENASILEIRGAAIKQVLKKKEALKQVLMNRILQNRYVQNYAWNSGFAQDPLQALDVDTYVYKLEEMFDPFFKTAISSVEREKLEKEAEDLKKNIDMTACRFCFQAFLPGPNGKFTKMLPPVYSEPIYDSKTREGCDLKIQRIDKSASSCEGNKEIWMIAKKIYPDQTQIIFSEKNGNGDIIWEEEASFNKTDVYNSCVIFKTPPYRNQNITQPVTVNISLKRKSDGSVSDPFQFTYKPKPIDPYGINEKKQKKISEETMNLINQADSGNPYAGPGYNFNPYLASGLSSASGMTNGVPPFNFSVTSMPTFAISSTSTYQSTSAYQPYQHVASGAEPTVNILQFHQQPLTADTLMSQSQMQTFAVSSDPPISTEDVKL